MKAILIAMLTFTSFSSWAHMKRLEPSIFDVTAINSPVKESTAKFSLKVPKNFDADEIKYKIKSANRLFEKDRGFETATIINGSSGKEIHVPVSKLAPGFYRLYVVIREHKTKKEHMFKLKLRDYAVFVIDKSLQVPMPNEKENNKTIAGIDTDGDGIRDDVQRWINENYSSKVEIKMGVRQMAMAKQLEILSVDNKEQSILASRKSLDSGSCLSAIVGLDEKIKIREAFELKFLNTKERHYADIKSNSNFSGQGYTLPDDDEEAKATCDF